MLYLLKSTNQVKDLGFHFEKLKRKEAGYPLFSPRNDWIKAKKIIYFNSGKLLIENLKAAKINEIDKALVSLNKNNKADPDRRREETEIQLLRW